MMDDGNPPRWREERFPGLGRLLLSALILGLVAILMASLALWISQTPEPDHEPKTSSSDEVRRTGWSDTDDNNTGLYLRLLNLTTRT